MTDRDSPSDDGAPWRLVDEGWGRRAVDFATLSEPSNCREYVAMHQHLAVGPGDRVLDIACGAGLAVELAAARGAVCAGIDASPRLIDVARDRNPGADVRVGDMHALPWDDATFDVVTSFRGIWGTTPDALAEVLRVLRPGGRVGITVWGHIKVSPGAWALAPFTLASETKVANQSAMVALGRPGAGEDLLARFGFADIVRVDIPFVWEFADPSSYARALASTGPAYEAIQTVGEEAFIRFATDQAAERARQGLPLRAPIAVVGYIAHKPAAVAASDPTGFLAVADTSADAQRLYEQDIAEVGYVMNASRLWAQQAGMYFQLFDLIGHAARSASLSFRDRGILVAACASTLGDAYCSLAWGTKLASLADPDLAAAVLRGDDAPLDPREAALAQWARRVTRDPNGTAAGDVQALRDAGFTDEQILAITVFVALRLAFSTVNDALAALPDDTLLAEAPPPVRAAVTFGRTGTGSQAFSGATDVTESSEEADAATS